MRHVLSSPSVLSQSYDLRTFVINIRNPSHLYLNLQPRQILDVPNLRADQAPVHGNNTLVALRQARAEVHFPAALQRPNDRWECQHRNLALREVYLRRAPWLSDPVIHGSAADFVGDATEMELSAF